METLPLGLGLVPQNRGTEQLALTPRFVLAQMPRYRCLVAKARQEASAVRRGSDRTTLAKLAEKLESEAACDEEEARNLAAGRDEATRRRHHVRDTGASGSSCERLREVFWRSKIVKSSAATWRPAPGIHA